MANVSQEKYSIAIVDDDATFRLFVSSLLQSQTGFEVFEASSGNALNDILDQNRIDCILLDYNLGDDTGFAIKERLDERYPNHPPIVMLTGDGRERTAIKALRMGLDDYVTKRDLRVGDLVTAITHAVRKGRKEQSVKADLQRLTETSGLDLATRLPGRIPLDERLAQLTTLSPAARSSYALVLIEMVEFNDIIEKLGLKAGDRALRAFAERFSRVARASDIFGRYEAGTFLLIADLRTDPNSIRALCQRIVAELTFRVEIEATGIDVSARAGATLCRQAAPDGAPLLEPAQEALMEAKRQGLGFFLSRGPETASPGIAIAETPMAEAAPPSEADQPSSSNRRREPRQRVLKRAQIVIPDLNSTIDCAVRNISTHGAGLRIDAPFPVPPEFELLILGTGTRRPVRVRWQVGNDLGVEFIS